VPLLLSKSTNLFKLFASDVGLLASILPIEVKSGKTYTRYHALDNVMNNSHYEIDTGIVLCNDNIHFEGNVWYCPIYLTGFFKKEENLEDIIYSIDLSQLQ